MCFVCVKSRKSNACSLQFTAPTNRFESVPHTCYWTREKSENRTKKKKRKTTEKCWQTARVAAVKRESLISGATAPPGRPQRPKRRRVRGQWMDRVAHSGVAFSYLSMEAKTSRRARRVEGKRQRNDRVRFFFYRILVSITQKASVFAFRIIFEPFSVNLTALVDEISWLGSNRWTFVKLRSLTFLVSAVTSRISFIKSTGQSFLPFLCKLTSMGYFLRLGLVLQTWSTQFKENTEKTPCLIENFAKKHSNHVFFVNFVSCLRHAIASFLLLVILNLLNTSW